ncbi:MAG: hypothetical protein HKM93_01175 [Desulfobacteraceae bacterium]|nr:hypothetical protein [Desulfobacteraceae bacterium]
MSFIGAVAASVRKVLAHYAPAVKHPVLIIGAGNFTVPSVLRSGGYSGPISCCDVSMYTSVLGAYLTDQEPQIQEKTDCPEHLRGLLCTDTPLDTAATLSLIYDLREVWQLKNPYQERHFQQVKAHWTDLVDRTRAKLKAYKEHIDPMKYTPIDGFDFLSGRDPEHTVFAFPPTYKKGYERLETLLRAVVQWDPPPYREMTDKSMDLYETIARFEAFFVVLEKDLAEAYAILGQPVAVLPRGRGNHTYIIARQARPKIVIKQTIKSTGIGSIWPADNTITGKETLTIAKLQLSQSIRLNELFLSSRIDYFSGGVGVSIGFFLDGRIIGKADFTPSAHAWKLPEVRPQIYIMSDLVVASNVKKLAKLILLGLLSRDVKETLDLKYIENFGYAVTTAFSRYPASMKYRGLFKLHTRKPAPGGHMLNYYAPFGDHGIADALKLWTSRYGR